MVLDYIENLELPDNLKAEFSNERQALNHLEQGLYWLYLSARAIEQKARKQMNNGAWLESMPPEVQKNFEGKNMRVFSGGNDPVLRWLPKGMLYCFFQWYSVSACNYVKLVGWILKQVDSNRPKPLDYVKSVIPDVHWFRDKIAAHFARGDKHKKDSEADRVASVMYQLTFDDGRFYAPSWKVTIRRAGRESSTNTQPWSLTETHEKLIARYWPKQINP